MRRPVDNARQELEGLADHLNPPTYNRLEAEVEEAEQEARQRAQDYLDRRLSHLDSQRQDLLVEACAVRDEYEELQAEGETGLIGADEFERRLTDLGARRRRVERKLTEVEEALESVERVEDEPLPYIGDLQRRTPHIQPLFSF